MTFLARGRRLGRSGLGILFVRFAFCYFLLLEQDISFWFKWQRQPQRLLRKKCFEQLVKEGKKGGDVESMAIRPGKERLQGNVDEGEKLPKGPALGAIQF